MKSKLPVKHLSSEMTNGFANIFLPVQLCQGTGVLVGCADDAETNIACAASLMLPESKATKATIDVFRDCLARSLERCGESCFVGLLTRGDDHVVLVAHAKETLDFCIQVDDYGNVVQSFVRQPSTRTMVVLYDAHVLERTPSFRERGVNALVGWLLECQQFRLPESVDCTADVVYASSDAEEISFLWQPAICAGSLIRAAKAAVDRKLPTRATTMLSTCAQATSTGALICKRLDDFAGVADSVRSHGRITLRCKNRMCSILLDCLLGACLAWVVHWDNGFSEEVPWASLEWTETVVQHLQTLIQWLMGAPAGLKLNAALNNALGRFFLYHISLWKTYVGVVDPWVGALFSLWPGSLTLHLALASDLLALATVHMYCFYGYACRLYQGWVRALGALWRLFRGRKWNPLRRRVDSHRYDVDQMFVGTLLFGVLFFLFPTVAVYYVVFMALRLVVLCIQGLLSRAVLVWDSLPFYTLAARTVSGRPIVGDVRFDALSSGPEFALYMQVTGGSVDLLPEPLGFPSWKDLLADLLVGRIVYPL